MFKEFNLLLLQIIGTLFLGNLILLLIPRCIRKAFTNTIRIMFKVIKFITSLVITQVKDIYIVQEKKKDGKSNPSNVIPFRNKKAN